MGVLVRRLRSIIVSVFDQIDRADEEEDGVKRSKADLRWLGSLSIPFSLVYQNSKVDGLVPIEVGWVLQRALQTAAATPAPLTGAHGV